MGNVTFLWFLLFSMCYSLHVTVNVCINCSFFITNKHVIPAVRVIPAARSPVVPTAIWFDSCTQKVSRVEGLNYHGLLQLSSLAVIDTWTAALQLHWSTWHHSPPSSANKRTNLSHPVIFIQSCWSSPKMRTQLALVLDITGYCARWCTASGDSLLIWTLTCIVRMVK